MYPGTGYYRYTGSRECMRSTCMNVHLYDSYTQSCVCVWCGTHTGTVLESTNLCVLPVCTHRYTRVTMMYTCAHLCIDYTRFFSSSAFTSGYPSTGTSFNFLLSSSNCFHL